MLFAYVVFFLFLLVLWLGICVEEDVDRITILPSRPSSLPPYFFLSLPTIFPLTQVAVKAGFGAV